MKVKERFYELPSCTEVLFGKEIKLLPSVSELFELELAFLEYRSLPSNELLNRSAYIQSINGKFTKHYLMYRKYPIPISEDRSAFTKRYFEEGKFSTGYATHGLFPYRGKFHPQLIKSLLNIMGIEKGQTVLDPMCGSGTANIEASMMGINSYGADISPFCQFMTKTKYEALTILSDRLIELSDKADTLFSFFNTNNIFDKLGRIKNLDDLKIYHLSLLAFLDAMGYARRVSSANHQQLYKKVFSRYINTVSDFLNNPQYDYKDIGWVKVLPDSEALNLELEENSIDGIIFSPPYSFAIDYAQNDSPQLTYLGYSVSELKSKMVGLIGRTKEERLNRYFQDMEKICYEVHRVLKINKYFVMIIGSNTNQTGGIRLEKKIIEFSEKIGLSLVKSILKPIKGLRNTMKNEYILIFKKK